MARARNIKPGFFKNDLLAEVDDQLHDLGFIIRYKIEANQYIAVINFSKHQNPHKAEKPSEIPPPGKHHASTVQAQDKHDTSRADSFNPHTDSLVPSTHVSRSASVSAPDQPNTNYSPEFEEFWQSYPRGRRKEKKAAYRAWKARVKAGAKPEQLIRAATLYAQECKGKDPRYIKLPKTFLGPDDHWEEYQELRSPDNNSQPELRQQYTHAHPIEDLEQVIQRKSMVGIEGGSGP